MMKMFLVSNIHHEAKDIIQYLKVSKSKRIALRKMQSENGDTK